MKTDLYIELNGVQTDYKVLSDTAKEIWKAEGKKVKDIESIELYFKPDEHTCYYVINSDVKGSFEI